ncbi:MAG: DUF4112 domain-containing protein [Candidatus Binatia bacterium]
MKPTKASPTDTVSHDALIPLEKLSWMLDAAFPVPGTRWRIGFDALLGLLPGIGDAVGAALSTYIIYEAARLGAEKRTIFKMVGNVACEAFIGLVPIFGDLFDVAWRSNLRNVELLRTDLEIKRGSPRSSQQIAILFATGAVVMFTFLLVLSLLMVRWLYRFITG